MNQIIANFWRRLRLVAEACLRKEGLAFVALMVSLTGTGIITFMLYGNLLYFRAQTATEQLFYLSCGMLFLIGIMFMSAHRLLGSKQAIELEFWKLKASISQGEDDEPVPPVAIAPEPRFPPDEEEHPNG